MNHLIKPVSSPNTFEWILFHDTVWSTKVPSSYLKNWAGSTIWLAQGLSRVQEELLFAEGPIWPEWLQVLKLRKTPSRIGSLLKNLKACLVSHSSKVNIMSRTVVESSMAEIPGTMVSETKKTGNLEAHQKEQKHRNQAISSSTSLVLNK